MEDNKKNILEMDLNEEQETALRETLESFKEDVYANMLEEVEEMKQAKIAELEEANEEWKSNVRQEYAEKMMEALSEMREEIKAEATAELVESNPELHVLEQIKELIAPTLNEEFAQNTYAQELVTLRNKLEEMEEAKNLEEGARVLADLIRPYSKKTQNILISVIQEGGPDEVTEQFYKILESIDSLSEVEEDEDEDEDDEEEDDEDDGKKKAKDDEDEDDEDEDEDEDDEEDDEETDEDFEEFETYIKESIKREDDPKKVNPLLSRISQLAD